MTSTTEWAATDSLLIEITWKSLTWVWKGR
jgi:hypothetical protein